MEYNLVNFCEIDKYAEKSYCAIHNVSADKNLGNICNVDILNLPKNIDLLTHGSPCVSFSKAGLRLGGDRGSGTPSSLMWNSVEIIKHCVPKFVIWENVANVLSPKHKHNFDEYIDELKNQGYTSYYKVMNSKNYGWPQNRERIFVLSVRNDIVEKSKIDFIFPEPCELAVKLSDLLIKNPDDALFLTDAQKLRFQTTNYQQNRRIIQRKDWCDALCARDFKDPKCVDVEGEKGPRRMTPQEYWRIMGFSDEDFLLAKSTGNSNSQLYKQAGNAIVLPVLRKIMKQIKLQYSDDFVDGLNYLSLFSGVGTFEMALKQI